jgi:glycerate dehydrogenase
VTPPRVAVTFAASPEIRAALNSELSDLATLAYLSDDPDALADADVVLAWSSAAELGAQAVPASTRFFQLLSAGVDQARLELIPDHVPVAANLGAYAEPMAEHVLAMALALAKRLPQNHAAMARGEFDQATPTMEIRGSVVGVLGFGGIGQASARLFRALGAHIHALNRSGASEEPADTIGTLADLDTFLAQADIVVVSLPLTRTTRGLLGRRELGRMKSTAILINVARAAIIDEDALYEHLRTTPTFSAGIDTWWQEPRHQGGFSTDHPFFELPNLLGSPHNSGVTRESFVTAAHLAAQNIARVLRGEPAEHLVNRDDYRAEA